MVFLHIGHDHLPQATGIGDFLGPWNWEATTLLPLLLLLGAYGVGLWRLHRKSRRFPVTPGRITFFVLGWLALFLALVSPIERYASELFYIHMVQHLLLVMMAAPLFLLANPMAIFLWFLPSTVRRESGQVLTRRRIVPRALRVFTLPQGAFILYTAALWAWHAPLVYQAALRMDPVHHLEHLTLFGTAALFWWPVIGSAPVRSRVSYPLRFLYLILATIQNTALGIILTFSDGVIYSYYEGTPAHWGIGVIADQQMGGLIMWVGGKMMYLLALAILFFAWFAREEQRALPDEEALDPRGGVQGR